MKRFKRVLLKCRYCGLSTNRLKAHIRQMHRKQYKLEDKMDAVEAVQGLTDEEKVQVLLYLLRNLPLSVVLNTIGMNFNPEDLDTICEVLRDDY